MSTVRHALTSEGVILAALALFSAPMEPSTVPLFTAEPTRVKPKRASICAEPCLNWRLPRKCLGPRPCSTVSTEPVEHCRATGLDWLSAKTERSMAQPRLEGAMTAAGRLPGVRSSNWRHRRTRVEPGPRACCTVSLITMRSLTPRLVEYSSVPKGRYMAPPGLATTIPQAVLGADRCSG